MTTLITSVITPLTTITTIITNNNYMYNCYYIHKRNYIFSYYYSCNYNYYYSCDCNHNNICSYIYNYNSLSRYEWQFLLISDDKWIDRPRTGNMIIFFVFVMFYFHSFFFLYFCNVPFWTNGTLLFHVDIKRQLSSHERMRCAMKNELYNMREQQRYSRACASAQSRQNLCSLLI